MDVLGEEADTGDVVEVEVFDLGLEDLGGRPGGQGGERFWLGGLGGEGGFEKFDLFLGEGAELAKFLGGNDHEVGGVEGVFLDGVAAEFEVEMRGEGVVGGGIICGDGGVDDGGAELVCMGEADGLVAVVGLRSAGDEGEDEDEEGEGE